MLADYMFVAHKPSISLIYIPPTIKEESVKNDCWLFLTLISSEVLKLRRLSELCLTPESDPEFQIRGTACCRCTHTITYEYTLQRGAI